MDASAHQNPPDLNDHTSFDVGGHARKYGIILGAAISLYLLIVNLIFTEDLPMGLRFAKYLLIVPVVWVAALDYAKRLPKGKVFKAEIGYLMKLAGYTALTVIVFNLLMFIVSGSSFDQFMQEGNTFAGTMINCGFLFFETVVIVMAVSFIFLQAFKSGGSPED